MPIQAGANVKLLQIMTLVVLFCIAGTAQCQSSQRIRVGFSFQDTQGLISHLNMQGYDARYGDECCQPEDDALGIWIGRKVPVDDVRFIITQAVKTYPRLVYYTHFGDERHGYPDSLDYAVYIGGSKRAAICNTLPVQAEIALQVFSYISTRDELDLFLDAVQLQETANDSMEPPCCCTASGWQ